MQFLTNLFRAKKAADDHRKASISAATPPEPKKEEVPYRHVPTHAYSDALNLGGAFISPDLHERIREENRRHSKNPTLRRTGSDTYLAHRASLAAQRSARESALYVVGDDDDNDDLPILPMTNAKKGKMPLSSPQRKPVMHLPLPPTSNPYAMPAALQSPKRLSSLRASPAGSMRGSPVGSMRSVPRSPLMEEMSITEVPEEVLPDDKRKGVIVVEDAGKAKKSDGYFPLQD